MVFGAIVVSLIVIIAVLVFLVVTMRKANKQEFITKTTRKKKDNAIKLKR